MSRQPPSRPLAHSKGAIAVAVVVAAAAAAAAVAAVAVAVVVAAAAAAAAITAAVEAVVVAAAVTSYGTVARVDASVAEFVGVARNTGPEDMKGHHRSRLPGQCSTLHHCDQGLETCSHSHQGNKENHPCCD